MLVELEDEVVDRIVINVLKDSYVSLHYQVFYDEDFIDMHEADQNFFRKSLHALEWCLRYLMAPAEAEKFIESCRSE